MKRQQVKNPSPGPAVGPDQSWKAARPEAVARARRLIQDKDYPSKEVLDSVANLLVKKLKRSK